MSQTQLASMRLGTVFLGDDRDVKPRKPMQRILIADGQTGEILDYITFKNIISDTHKKSLENSLETFNFITFGDKRFSQFLEKRNRIIIPDEDGNLAEFVPFEIPKYRDSEGHKIQVFAHGSYLELKKASVINPGDYTGTATQHLGRALNNSGWRAGIVESGGSRSIAFENHTNPFAYIKRIARELELEPNFRIEHDGTKITGRYVDLLERSGEWRNRIVEFGKDLDGIRRVEKQDIYTALVGIMPEDEEGNQRTVLVEDEEALQRWGRIDEFGELQHLIGVHEIQSTRAEMTEAEAIQYTRTELDKRINTVITYEVEIVDLEHVPGMENKKIRHGDTIRIKDMKFNPPLYLEARVFESEGSIKERGNKKVKLGDFVEFTEDEVNAIWNQLKSQIRNRITASELAEYTYNKITIDSKDNTVRSEVESYANTVSSDAKDEAITYTNNTIEPIVVSVGNLSDSIDDIESDVSDYANQITQAQTDITQAWDEINLKAAKTEVDLIESRVSTAESELLVQAGIIEGKAESTVVDSLGVRTTNVEQSLDAIEGQIVNKVEVNDVVSIFTQEAGSFTFDADQINFDGHVFGGNATFTGKLQGAEILGSNIIQQGSVNDIELNEDGLFIIDRSSGKPRISMLTDDGEQSGVSIYPSLIHFEMESQQNHFAVGTNPVGMSDAILGFMGQSSRDRVLDIYSEIINVGGHVHVIEDLTLTNALSGGGRNNALHFGTGNSRHTIGDWSGDFTFYGNRSNGRPFLVRSHSSGSGFRDDLWVDDDGRLYSPATYSFTSSSSANIGMQSNERFYRSTSAKKYKRDIERATNIDPYRIHELQPSSWIDKLEYEENGHSKEGLTRYYGIIADEMEEIGLPEYVVYENGEVENIVERAWTLLIPISRDHEIKISDLIVKVGDHEIKLTKHEQRIFVLENKVEAQDKEIKKLKGVA